MSAPPTPEAPAAPVQQPTVAAVTPVPTEVAAPPVESAAAAAAPFADERPAPMTIAEFKQRGLVPIKHEYMRCRVEREATSADGKTRGMNKRHERANIKIEGDGQRPLWADEKNFLPGPNLVVIKATIKANKATLGNPDARQQAAKRMREEEELQAKARAAREVLAAAIAKQAADARAAAGEPPLAAPAQASPAVPAFSGPAKPLVAISKSDEPVAERRKRLFENKLVLAPLTTVGNLPFRRICKGFGVDVTVGEMALTGNLVNTSMAEWSLLRRHKSEDVFGIQIATSRGNEASLFATALAASDFEYDYIEINCGCPIDAMTKKGHGCGLWEKRARMREVVEGLVKYQPQPVAIKCRIGVDEDRPTLHNIIGEYESWGASSITVHGRSKRQRYTKYANWEYIERCTPLTNLPVAGNGDVFSYEDWAHRKEVAPNVSSVMVGRGALIKPWVFKEIKEERVWDIRSSERLDMLKEYAEFGLEHWGSDAKGVAATRRFLCEWQSFLHRYVPVGLLEQQPQRLNDRPPAYVGRDDLETLMASDSSADWVRITEMLLGPAGDAFKFTPKHKSSSYASSADAPAATVEG